MATKAAKRHRWTRPIDINLSGLRAAIQALHGVIPGPMEGNLIRAESLVGQLATKRIRELEAEVAALRENRQRLDPFNEVHAALDGADWTLVNPNGWFVYVIWGDDQHSPLYVGKSSNLFGRLGAHLSNEERGRHIRRVSLLRCFSARAMDDTEAQLIYDLRPPWNTKMTAMRPMIDCPPLLKPGFAAPHTFV